MDYISVAQAAEFWKISERSVRNYCAIGKIGGAFLTGKTWNIPADAKKPGRVNTKRETPKTLIDILQLEKKHKIKGGIYHKIQIDLTYNSNHIEGSRLTHDQTRFIYETNTIGLDGGSANIDDIVETANHFKCIDMVIENAKGRITEKFIKDLHRVLKNGTTDSRQEWFAVGDYKHHPNEVGGHETTPPEQVAGQMQKLLTDFNGEKQNDLADILAFHVRFERIHPFQDGNGRVGRLVMFMQCLKNNVVLFIIDDDMKAFYYRGLSKWGNENGYLTDTCGSAQEKMKKVLDYFRVEYF